jgi:hypothetical protein
MYPLQKRAVRPTRSHHIGRHACYMYLPVLFHVALQGSVALVKPQKDNGGRAYIDSLLLTSSYGSTQVVGQIYVGAVRVVFAFAACARSLWRPFIRCPRLPCCCIDMKPTRSFSRVVEASSREKTLLASTSNFTHTMRAPLC